MGELRERGAIWWIRCYRNGRRKRTNVGDVTELAVSLPLWQRIRSAVTHAHRPLRPWLKTSMRRWTR
jgi:hypothetical protein